MFYCITPNDPSIIGASDSISIQNAVDQAQKTGLNEIIIPRYNARTQSMLWEIDRTIRIPSDMTITLDNCHLRMADGVICNMFTNSNARTEIGNKPEGTQRNIRILGRGNAVLDGGEPNGLNERTGCKNGLPHISHNLTIYLHNVENFTIEGFTIQDQRWWGMAFMFARTGRVANLQFRLTRHEIDTYDVWHNQDGIDLRVGCSNIQIENIEGEAGDDLVALTALSGINFEEAERVEGWDRDIHDVIIHNIRGISNMCALVRLLNQFGQKLYNISMSNLMDISRPGKEASAQMVVRIGDDFGGYYRNDPANRAKPGDMFNITVDNVFSRSRCAISACCMVKNLTVRNIHVFGNGGFAFMTGLATVPTVFIYHPSREAEYEAIPFGPHNSPKAVIENALVENIYYDGDGTHSPAVCGYWNTEGRNIVIRNVVNNTTLPVMHYFDEVPGSDALRIEE